MEINKINKTLNFLVMPGLNNNFIWNETYNPINPSKIDIIDKTKEIESSAKLQPLQKQPNIKL